MKINDFFKKQDIEFGNEINVYVCGPTVYNHAHIGNVRPALIFDVFNRVYSLEGKMNYVHNITDIDDKIIKKAKELGRTEKEVSEEFAQAYLDLLDSLNIIRPTEMPKVTDHIPGIQNFVQLLIEKGYAYEVNGSVYFSVKKWENYGKLVNLSLEDLIDEEGGLEEKEDPKDFALWKSTTEGIQFDSPWGKGRPGWHTECSYFLHHFFGDKGIQLHGGGIDLKFPHHVNEMAQYEALRGEKSDNAWLYVGHITMGNEKMSKSLGNIIIAKDFVEAYGANVLRYLILSVQYLKPLNVNDDAINNAVNTIRKIKSNIQKNLLDIIEYRETIELNNLKSNEVIDELKNNLDTGKAFTIVFELIKKMNLEKELEGKAVLLEEILGSLSLLGIQFEIKYSELRDDILKAREAKDYSTLDKLREELIK